MRMPITKAVAYCGAAIATVAAATTLTLGSTMALFSATQTSASSSFTSGTVSVGLGATSTTCSVTAMTPGDSSTNYGSGSASLTPCDYKVKYTGSVAAYLAVDISVTAGSTALYTATGSGLQLKVGVNGGATVMSGTTYKNTAGTDTTLVAGTPVTNILLSTTPASTDDASTFNIDYLLPLLAPNSLQGGTASITLTFHAVQAANQSVGSCTAGQQCSTIVWS
ncbi:MAG: hypothetical protein RJA47_734 [Actinomycetota bacterium]